MSSYEAHKKWRNKNPELAKAQYRRSQARQNARLWDEFFAQYGHKCACCGESDRRFLTIEHIDGVERNLLTGGNGRGKRKTGPLAIREAKRMGWPSNITVLCFNCNCGRARNGNVCPHEDGAFDRTMLEVTETKIEVGFYGGPVSGR